MNRDYSQQHRHSQEGIGYSLVNLGRPGSHTSKQELHRETIPQHHGTSLPNLLIILHLSPLSSICNLLHVLLPR